MAGSYLVNVAQWEDVNTSNAVKDGEEEMDCKVTTTLGRLSEFETEASLCERIVPELCEKGSLSTIKELADSLTDLPENHLVRMILCVLKNDDESCDSVMEALLQRRISSAAVTSQLSQWHISDVTQLASYVTDRLQTADCDLTPALTEWLVALLDALYARMLDVDQPALLDLLEQVSAWREREESSVKEAELLKRDMDLLKWTVRKPPPPPASNYTVETLYL